MRNEDQIDDYITKVSNEGVGGVDALSSTAVQRASFIFVKISLVCLNVLHRHW